MTLPEVKRELAARSERDRSKLVTFLLKLQGRADDRRNAKIAVRFSAADLAKATELAHRLRGLRSSLREKLELIEEAWDLAHFVRSTLFGPSVYQRAANVDSRFTFHASRITHCGSRFTFQPLAFSL